MIAAPGARLGAHPDAHPERLVTLAAPVDLSAAEMGINEFGAVSKCIRDQCRRGGSAMMKELAEHG